MPNLNRLFRGPMAYLLLILVLVFLFFRFFAASPQVEQARLSDVVKSITDGRVKEIVLKDQDHKITGTYTDGRKFEASYTELQGKDLFNLAREEGVQSPGRRPRPVGARPDPHPAAPLRRAPAAVLLPHAADAGWRQPGDELRQVQGPPGHQGPAQDHLRGRGRGRRGGRGAPGDQGVPREPGQVPGHGGQDPQGRAAVRPPGDGQDPAGPGRGRGGRGAVLLHLRLGLRGDVRRRRRLPRP